MFEAITLHPEEVTTGAEAHPIAELVPYSQAVINEVADVEVSPNIFSGDEYVVVNFPYSEAQIERYQRIQKTLVQVRAILDRYSLVTEKGNLLALTDHPLQLLSELELVFDHPDMQLPSLQRSESVNQALFTDTSEYTFALRNVLQTHETAYRSLRSILRHANNFPSSDQVVMSLKQVMAWFDEKMSSSL